MLGQPKYKKGDTVGFCLEKGKCATTGVIEIVDAYGTFGQNKEVSYDIYNKDKNILYKHIVESNILTDDIQYPCMFCRRRFHAEEVIAEASDKGMARICKECVERFYKAFNPSQEYTRHPELTDEYYLVHLAEECSELAQAAIKAARFGIEHVHPKTGIDNITRLNNEFNDVVAIASILGLKVNSTEQSAKGDKVNKYLSQCQDMWKNKSIVESSYRTTRVLNCKE